MLFDIGTQVFKHYHHPWTEVVICLPFSIAVIYNYHAVVVICIAFIDTIFIPLTLMLSHLFLLSWMFLRLIFTVTHNMYDWFASLTVWWESAMGFWWVVLSGDNASYVVFLTVCTVHWHCTHFHASIVISNCCVYLILFLLCQVPLYLWTWFSRWFDFLWICFELFLSENVRTFNF